MYAHPIGPMPQYSVPPPNVNNNVLNKILKAVSTQPKRIGDRRKFNNSKDNSRTIAKKGNDGAKVFETKALTAIIRKTDVLQSDNLEKVSTDVTVVTNQRDAQFYDVVIRDFWECITDDFRHPYSLLGMAVFTTMAFYLYYQFPTSPLANMCPAPTPAAPSSWICAHLRDGITRVIGTLFFLPTIWFSVDVEKRFSMLLTAAIYLLVIPFAGFWEYAIQAAALHFYLKAKDSRTRLSVIVFMIGIYVIGYLEMPGNADHEKHAAEILKGTHHTHPRNHYHKVKQVVSK